MWNHDLTNQLYITNHVNAGACDQWNRKGQDWDVANDEVPITVAETGQELKLN